MILPVYCVDCGAYLADSWTQHRPDCSVLALISESFGDVPNAAPEDIREHLESLRRPQMKQVMTKVRRHRSTLTESMETVFEVENFEQLVEAINKDPFAEAVAPEKVHVERYVRDERIGWDTYLVTIDGRGVWGMTNGALK